MINKSFGCRGDNCRRADLEEENVVNLRELPIGELETMAWVVWTMGGVMVVFLIAMMWWRYRAGVKMIRALHKSEDRLRGAIESLQEGFVLFDKDDRLIMMNDVYRRMNPAAEDFLKLGMSFEDSIRAYVEHGLIVEALGPEEEFIHERLEQHRNPKGSILRQFTNGSWYIIKETHTPEGGTATTFTDITGLKHSEEALRESQQRFKDIAESASDWFWEMGPDLRFTYFSDRYAEISNFDPKDRLGTKRQDYVPPDELEANPEKWAAHLADLEARRPFRNFEYVSTATTEGTRHVRVSGKPLFDADGNLLGYRGTGTDISEYKQAEQALKEREKHFHAVTEIAPNAIINIDQGGKVIMWNKAAEKIFGYTEAEIVGKSVTKIMSKRFHKRHKNGIRRIIETGRSDLGNKTTELMGLRKDGTEFPVELSLSMWEMEGKKEKNFVGILRDITERKRAEEELRENEDRFRSAFENVAVGNIVITDKGIIEIFNGAAEKIFGYTADEVIGQSVNMLMPEPDRNRHDGYMQKYLETGKTKVVGSEREVKGLRKNGEEFPMHLGVGEMRIGDKVSFVGSISDLTQTKVLEAQLAQAQKMEAVGQLTGGVAHDFNNLLAIIMGNLECLDRTPKEDGEFDESLTEAFAAVERGSKLTYQLLAFSRQQTLRPEIANANTLIFDTIGLLQRTLGEDINIMTAFSTDTDLIKVDHGMLGNAVLNLALNARDAMSGGGKLTIKTSNVDLKGEILDDNQNPLTGPHVLISVADNGAGIKKKDLKQVFEPFFTTKGVGEGSGLGLSMVYGFVKQSGGHVTIDSKRGKGTTVNLYFPAEESLTGDSKTEAAPSKFELKGTETILVVEDDEDVRRTIVRMLSSLDYNVLEAKDGPSALEVLDKDGNGVNLVYSDVIMPSGMSGFDLAHKLKRRHYNGIKVLLTSGYPDKVIGTNDFDKIGVEMLAKPYRREQLAKKLRAVLDQ